jgi:hypothetical protein
MSSQNFVFPQFLSLKQPVLQKSSFTFIKPFENGESNGCAVIWESVLECRYLLGIISCQTPSSLISLNSHLIVKHLFFSSKLLSPQQFGHLDAK